MPTTKLAPPERRHIPSLRVLAIGIAALAITLGCRSHKDDLPPELPTAWQSPPGDHLELETAGFAKVLCSGIFITGRTLAESAEEDGYFVSPKETRRLVKDTVVDRQRHEVRLTLPNGVTRVARQFGDQGCVTLPKGRDSVNFTPEHVTSTLPDPATQPWPMGDQIASSGSPPGVDTAAVTRATNAAFDSGTYTAAWIVLYKGQIIAERYRAGVNKDTRLPSWSMGKSLTATLMGQLIHEGVYDLWSPAPVAEWKDPKDPRHAIRIADLLRMSSGLRFVAPFDPGFDSSRGYPDHLYVYTGAENAYQYTITRPPQWPPNTIGRYRNSDPLTLNYLIKQAVTSRGEDYLSYPQRHLFDKLGIRHMTPETDPSGNFLLQGYELGSARDWARLGQLYLQDGVWNGERILPEGWSKFVSTPAPAWREPVYGGAFWLNRTHEYPIPEDAYYMSGVGGQETFIIPTHDLVVVRLGHFKGAEAGDKALKRALGELVKAVPRSK
jgi:CubicO group peptidase (beta-lactamase class C family)